MAGKSKQMFLLARTCDPSEVGGEVIYCCVPISQRSARNYLASMRVVRRLKKSGAFGAYGTLYGAELWHLAQWLVLCDDGEKGAILREHLAVSAEEAAVFAGLPEDWGLVPPGSCSFDLQSVLVTEDSLHFQCRWKNTDHPLSANPFYEGLLQQASRGEALGFQQ